MIFSRGWYGCTSCTMPPSTPVFGQWMIQELARHGYQISPGTLYPMLAKLERDGYLVSHSEREGRTGRKFYTITDHGREGLAVARLRLSELKAEVKPHE